MGAEQDFDRRVRTALERECDGISASEELKGRIDEAIRQRQEENSMKHKSVKKLGTALAAACLLVSGVTVWAGSASYFVTGASTEPAYTDYRDMEKAEEELGYGVDSVERFANGFSFHGMSVDRTEAYAEGNGKMYSVPALDIRYRKGEKSIDLTVNEKLEASPADASSKEPEATRTCGDVTLRYDEYTNKIVPASYELTEEDRRNEQRDDYHIVYLSVVANETPSGKEGTQDASLEDGKYGSYTVSDDGEVTLVNRGGQDSFTAVTRYGEVCIQQLSTVSWEKDGVSYHLSGTDLGLGAEEMLDMAEEILAAK